MQRWPKADASTTSTTWKKEVLAGHDRTLIGNRSAVGEDRSWPESDLVQLRLAAADSGRRSAARDQFTPATTFSHARRSTMNQDSQPSRTVLPIPERGHVGLTTYDAKDPETSFPPIEPVLPP